MNILYNKIARLEELFVSLEDGLLIKLRMGEGLDLVKLEQIDYQLTDLKKELYQQDVIPKRLASLFIDIQLSMEGTLSLYNEKEQELILDATDQIMDLVRECVN